MLNDKQGLHMTSMDEFMLRNVLENNDIQVGRLEGIDENKMNKILRDTLLEKNDDGAVVPKDIPYNKWNLIGINGGKNNTFICSGLVEYVYRLYDPNGSYGIKLFDEHQFQYSPVDIYSSVKNKGRLIY